MFALIWWVIVGLIAGWATGKIMGGTGRGFLVDIIVGIAVLLTFLYRLVTGSGKGGRGSGETGFRRAA
jgi:uncharacterized membrane protein YeaQ/YmgE (transglycosylase-associated protein family)